MRYLVVRHAQTDANRRGEFPQLDEPLSVLGRQQCQALATRMAGRSFDALVHSGSVRAEQTAMVVLPAIRVERVITDPRTLEGEVGEWVGKRASMRTEAAEESGLPLWEVRPPGGESYLDIDARLQSLLADIRAGAFGSTVLLVGHGRVNGLLLRALLGTPWPDFDPLQMHHTGVTEIEAGAGRVEVLALDDVSHLPPEMVTR